MDFIQTSKEIIETETNINAADWVDNWEENYVVFADLIAFASRCMISTGITLNNIVRFHRAVKAALQGIDNITKFQFTDACYIITKDPKIALIVAANIQNECLLQNFNQIRQIEHTMFYNMIVPKVVISKGNILRVKPSDESEIIMNAGISSKELLAGSGIVKAYNLEKKTTGGMVSVDQNIIESFKTYNSRQSKLKTNGVYKTWQNDRHNKVLAHDGVVDIPWLVLQPRQVYKGALITESEESFKEKVKSFNHIWRTSFTEHLVERTPTDTLKQYGGGISHLCEIMQLYSNTGPRSWDLINLNAAIESL